MQVKIIVMFVSEKKEKEKKGVGVEVRPKNPLVHFLIDNDLLMQLLDML